ncbi:hypothetical protein [Clostridium beijerinckii]|uniref:Uncharacterized protein n=1 Tax=Clostridium beijerinckii TaxID=1520 RepID=A0A1S8S2P2_CLOBE|nr:hypothetical protein [Clostridium beijerinckii]NRY63293.1 hypothetical protein [Clostridium beijerinckii]OOM59733.1 hypothetical protein CLBCK_33230 [Clostridium beijerinckii]
MDRYVKIEQMLNGYQKGHCKIASSIKLSLNDENIINILSDVSGMSSNIEWESYITGYPLENQNIYVFAKTWTAKEMKRPGCVWTHSLLIDIDELKYIKSANAILKSFKYPSNSKHDYYENEIFLDTNENNEYENLRFDKKQYEYIVYTMLSNDNSVIIENDKSDDYAKIIIDILIQQNKVFLNQFSFCTKSFNSRKLNRQDFSYQIVPQNLGNRVIREISEKTVFYKDIEYIEQLPKWVNLITIDFINHNMDNFECYKKLYGSLFETRKYFNKFAKMFYAFNNSNINKSFLSYMNAVRTVFKDEYEEISYKTIEIICNNHNMQWFNNRNISELCLELVDDNEFFIENSNRIISYLRDILYDEYRDSIYTYFKKSSNDSLNDFGSLLVNELLGKIKVEDFAKVSNMEFDVSLILIKANSNLICCRDIWKQSIEYQIGLISQLDINSIEFDFESFVNQLILNCDNEIADKVFEIAGDKLVEEIWNWCRFNQFSCELLYKWVDYLLYNVKQCLEQVSEINNRDFVFLILSKINTYHIDLNSINPQIWLTIFRNNRFGEWTEKENEVAILYLPIVLKVGLKFPNDMVNFCFNIVNNLLATDKINGEEWRKVDSLLPQTPLIGNWDKCKRLKKAFKYKGYMV